MGNKRGSIDHLSEEALCPRQTLFIFGFGYTAQVLAQQLKGQGIPVVGTSRKPAPQAISAEASIRCLDFNSPQIAAELSQATHLLLSIPPSAQHGDPVLYTYADLIKRYAPQLQWVGYLSSTGVYGDHQGRWVDETSACEPIGTSGILRLQAEQSWLSFAKAYELPLHIFRLAGIYGPGRNALDRLQQEKSYSIYKEGHFFSRIHVEDIASVLLASMHLGQPLGIYNVADDKPEASHVVEAFAASLLGLAPLPLVPINEASLSPMALEFYASNKQVSNQKIKTELNCHLLYPSFREGLTQIYQEGFAKTII